MNYGLHYEPGTLVTDARQVIVPISNDFIYVYKLNTQGIAHAVHSSSTLVMTVLAKGSNLPPWALNDMFLIVLVDGQPCAVLRSQVKRL